MQSNPDEEEMGYHEGWHDGNGTWGEHGGGCHGGHGHHHHHHHHGRGRWRRHGAWMWGCPMMMLAVLGGSVMVLAGSAVAVRKVHARAS